MWMATVTEMTENSTAAMTTHSDAAKPARRKPMACQPGNDHQLEAMIQAAEIHQSQLCRGRGVQMVARMRP